jgi:restriction endonuclease Mrr
LGTAATDAVGGKPSRSDAKSPDERIDEATSKLGESLSDELLQMVMDKEPAFFGALGSIHDGAFITTSSFSKEVIDAAERLPARHRGAH